MQKNKSFHENTCRITRNILTVVSPALIFLTHLISVPIALNSDYQPQLWEARHCLRAFVCLRSGSRQLPLCRLHTQPSSGWVGPAWRGRNAQRYLWNTNAMGSSLAAPSLPAAVGSAGLSQNCTVSTPPSSLPVWGTPLGSPAWQPIYDVLGGCFSCPPLFLKATTVTCRKVPHQFRDPWLPLLPALCQSRGTALQRGGGR